MSRLMIGRAGFVRISCHQAQYVFHRRIQCLLRKAALLHSPYHVFIEMCIRDRYKTIPGLSDLTGWVDQTKALSNSALEQAIRETGSECLQKALHWSQQVNASINQLDESLKKPFDGASQGLAAAAEFADVAVVSSDNRDAVLEEWGKYGLLDHVDLVLAQDAGSKQHCIAMLLETGYAPAHVLMVGDAPGDRAAAQTNGVYFYPILVKKEAASWQEFCEKATDHLRSESYAAYGAVSYTHLERRSASSCRSGPPCETRRSGSYR